jgi:hypothetical protein
MKCLFQLLLITIFALGKSSRLNLAILESSVDQDKTTGVPTHEIAQMAVPEPVGQQAHFSKIGGKCEGVCWNGIADRQKL